MVGDVSNICKIDEYKRYCKRDLLYFGKDGEFMRDMSEWWTNLKRLKIIDHLKLDSWKFIKLDFTSKELTEKVFEKYRPGIVVNLAAQAGVRYSLENPNAYIFSNIVGFSNILECCRKSKVEHLLYASSS